MNHKNNSFADWRWNTVRGDAQVCTHVETRHFRYCQVFSIYHVHCKIKCYSIFSLTKWTTIKVFHANNLKHAQTKIKIKNCSKIWSEIYRCRIKETINLLKIIAKRGETIRSSYRSLYCSIAQNISVLFTCIVWKNCVKFLLRTIWFISFIQYRFSEYMFLLETR